MAIMEFFPHINVGKTNKKNMALSAKSVLERIQRIISFIKAKLNRLLTDKYVGH